MATKIIMPKQGLQMTEGTIIKWLAKEGDSVTTGKPLFEIETDKLTITIDSTADGKLLKIIRQEGEVVPITDTIGIIGEDGEDISVFLSPNVQMDKATPVPDLGRSMQKQEDKGTDTSKPEDRIFITPRAKTTAQQKGIDFQTVVPSGPDGLIIERDILAAQVKATPVAMRLAEMNEVDLKSVKGSGVGGKVMKQDIYAAMNGRAKQEETVIEIAGMRKAICDNMMASLHGMAQANHRMQVDMSQPALIRQAFKLKNKTVSYNDILIMAVSRALLEFPQMNALVEGNKIRQKHYVNMGVAVAVENGLIVPTVRATHHMTLEEIHEETSRMIELVKQSKLTRADYSDATFTLTNLGMFDVDEFTAIINPPQVGILAIGKIADRPVVVQGQIVIRPMLTLSLTYDHRVVDGAPAAQFLQHIKVLLENPYIMLT